jgi:hypothetical protein
VFSPVPCSGHASPRPRRGNGGAELPRVKRVGRFLLRLLSAGATASAVRNLPPMPARRIAGGVVKLVLRLVDLYHLLERHAGAGTAKSILNLGGRESALWEARNGIAILRLVCPTRNMHRHNPMSRVICIAYRCAPWAGKTGWARAMAKIVNQTKVKDERFGPNVIRDCNHLVRLLCKFTSRHFVRKLFRSGPNVQALARGGADCNRTLKARPLALAHFLPA